jgi:hypothetical protein
MPDQGVRHHLMTGQAVFNLECTGQPLSDSAATGPGLL